jgi:hypothetical protein
MKGLRVYRNMGTGLFMHISRNMQILSSFFSDNQLGIDLDRVNNISIDSTMVVGISKVQRGNSFSPLSKCSDKKIVGIEVHTWKDDEAMRGAYLNGVIFSDFNNHGCSSSVPLSLDSTVSTNFYMFSCDIPNNTQPCSFQIDKNRNV